MPSNCRASYFWNFVNGSFHNYDYDVDSATAVVALAHLPLDIMSKCKPQKDKDNNDEQCPPKEYGRRLGANGE